MNGYPILYINSSVLKWNIALSENGNGTAELTSSIPREPSNKNPMTWHKSHDSQPNYYEN